MNSVFMVGLVEPRTIHFDELARNKKHKIAFMGAYSQPELLLQIFAG